MASDGLSLGRKQRLFVQLLARLIDYAYANGYELSLGEAWRTPEQARLNAEQGKGVEASLHLERLAIDLNLFRNGTWLQGTEDHRPLGEHWESLHPLCRWGGRFQDGNHYSITHGGRK